MLWRLCLEKRPISIIGKTDFSSNLHPFFRKNCLSIVVTMYRLDPCFTETRIERMKRLKSEKIKKMREEDAKRFSFLHLFSRKKAKLCEHYHNFHFVFSKKNLFKNHLLSAYPAGTSVPVWCVHRRIRANAPS